MSVGEYLGKQRRLRGISLDELCELTKIPRRNLERLEAGAFDEQPDGFARGFVRTVAGALGLDPDEAVMRLMQEPEADAAPAAGIRVALALRAFGLLMAVGSAVLLWKLAGDWLAGGREAQLEPAVTYRRDAVGDLARERQSPAPRPASRPAVAVPTPPAEPEPAR